MANVKLVVQHHLDQLSPEDLAQYLRDVSVYIGLDPDLNGLDTIWLDNETGVGRTKVVYAKRGTAEILRNVYHVNVEELSHTMVGGSIVFTAAGRGGRETTRVERAIGSKYITGLTGRALDNGIMTASTRALRRLTMQFTTLGILDESEVVDFVGQQVNPAAGAELAGSPIVIPLQPSVVPNNAPGKVVGATESFSVSQDPRTQAQVATIIAIREIDNAKAARLAADIAAEADKKSDTPKEETPVTPVESTTLTGQESGQKSARKPRKPKNTVSLEVEPEVVNTPVICPDCKTPLAGHPLVNSVRTCPSSIQTIASAVQTVAAPEPKPFSPEQAARVAIDPLVHQAAIELGYPLNALNAPPPVPTVPVNVAPPPVAAPAADMPTKEQMDEYRKKIGVFTQQLPATPGSGSVQRMRAFITKMFDAAPQNMNVTQWGRAISWFDEFSQRNGVKGLINFIGDTLGDVPKK